MSDLSPERKQIQVEETRFRYAVSESMIQRIGKAINFINLRQHNTKQFFINGPYRISNPPVTGVDGLIGVEFDIEIIDVFMFNLVAGSSGTTELDIKYATTPSGTFTSIFSTTPKIQHTAGNNVWVFGNSSFTAPIGTTKPVLSTTNLDKFWVLRCDMLQKQDGDPENCGISIYYRPR